MSRTVLVIDTSILCVWLSLPGFETCGPDEDRWDKPRVDAFFQQHLEAGATLVLPLASIIETGNHIAQNAGNRFELAQKLCDILLHAVDGTAPYAAFAEQSVLWSPEQLRQLAGESGLRSRHKLSRWQTRPFGTWLISTRVGDSTSRCSRGTRASRLCRHRPRHRSFRAGTRADSEGLSLLPRPEARPSPSVRFPGGAHVGGLAVGGGVEPCAGGVARVRLPRAPATWAVR